MSNLEPQSYAFAGYGIELQFTRRWAGSDLQEPTITSLKVGGRPLVVIDPEDREAVERLRSSLIDEDILDASWDESVIRVKVTRALREFANPTPPKPEEPTGLGAVMEDGCGQRWVRKGLTKHGEDWALQVGSAWVGREYAHIDVTRVISEGVCDA